MNFTGGYHLPKTNGTISHDDLLPFDSNLSQATQQSSYQAMHGSRSTGPFYLLSHHPSDPAPTSGTNLIVHKGLNRDFEKYVRQPIAPSLSDFLTHIPHVETAQQKAASFAGKNGEVGTLRSLFSERIVTKEIVPFTEQQLNAFRLHRDPILPEMYHIYTNTPKESRTTTLADLNLPSSLTNPMPGPSPQVQRVLNEQTARVSPDVKRKAPADTTPALPSQPPTTTPVASGIVNRTSTSTPTLANNVNLAAANPSTMHLNDDPDDPNSSKRKTKKTKKEKKP